MDQTKPKLRYITSWDDGDSLDVKLATLLKKYGLRGIFYIPTMHSLTVEEIIALDKDGFEIGAHTVDHPMDMKLLSEEQILYQIHANKKYLETLINKPVSKFCYPRGRFDTRVIKILKDQRFRTARTTVVLKTETEDPLQQPTTIHVFDRKEYLGKSWIDVAISMAHYASRTNGVFHIWGHSWEIERDGHWKDLEIFFKHLTSNYQLTK